jgi:hypothetical protein
MMVQALVTLDENDNRVLNVIKAKYELKDKGEAISLLINRYIEESNEPELRPEFIKKIRAIEKQKRIKVTNFKRRYGLK